MGRRKGGGDDDIWRGTNERDRGGGQVAKYRDLCPPGTEDSAITVAIERSKGDAQKMETAISELWENHRGGGQADWATVAKKSKKKTVRGSHLS